MMPQGRLDKPAESAARLPRAKLVLHLALLVAGLQLPLPLMHAQTASRPPAPARLPAAASAHFAAGRKLLGQHTPKLAEAEIRAGLKLAPQSLEGLNLLGIALGGQKDFTGAVETFQQALKLDPHSAETHNNLGNSYVVQQKSDLAESEFRGTLRYHPRNRDANYNLGLLLLARNDPRDAITYFSRVQPQGPEVLFNLTQAYLGAGQKEKGLELARSLSEQAKNDVRAHFTLGVLLAKQKQYDAAIHEFEVANSLQPNTFEILHNLGQAYLKKGDNEKARIVLGRVLRVSPESAETLYLIAQTYSEEGKDLDALELLVKAHKLAPRDTDVIFLMARLSMKQAFYEDAIPLLEEGLKVVPHRPSLLAALGECYFMMGNVEKAKDTFQTLIQVDPSARSYAFMGLCYRNLGRFDEAQKYLEQGLKVDPHDVSCLYNMGYIASRQGQYDMGEKWLKQALEVDPDYAEALLELANLKMHQKKFEEAVPLLRKCAKLHPHPAPVYYRLQAAERELHQTEAAERDLKIFQTLSRDPNPAPAPFQHIFAYLDQRADLSPQQRTQFDVEQLEKEVKLHSGQPQNLYFLAEAYLKQGRVEDAKQAIAQLDQLSQGDFRTTMGVGVLLARYRLYAEAVAHFQEALKSNPNSDDAWYDLADAYFRKRDYANALTAAQHVSGQGQKDASYLALLADIFAHLGRFDEAVRLLRQEIAENPDQGQAYLSLALVYLRSGNTSGASEALQRGLERTPDSGELLWGVGVLSAVEGDTEKAERHLKESVDLLPGWPGGYSALGVLYYQTGQIDKARETLERFKQGGPRGALDVQRIEQTLSAAASESSSSGRVRELTPQARQQFLQIALALADQSP
ncbi:MAG: tetratricopeptide repeat protein [Acidobacteriia bacterium]|nr:tetratricopeptide repeat protein [Terriglobia bacterium]